MKIMGLTPFTLIYIYTYRANDVDMLLNKYIKQYFPINFEH